MSTWCICSCKSCVITTDTILILGMMETWNFRTTIQKPHTVGLILDLKEKVEAAYHISTCCHGRYTPAWICACVVRQLSPEVGINLRMLPRQPGWRNIPRTASNPLFSPLDTQKTCLTTPRFSSLSIWHENILIDHKHAALYFFNFILLRSLAFSGPPRSTL